MENSNQKRSVFSKMKKTLALNKNTPLNLLRASSSSSMHSSMSQDLKSDSNYTTAPQSNESSPTQERLLTANPRSDASFADERVRKLTVRVKELEEERKNLSTSTTSLHLLNDELHKTEKELEKTKRLLASKDLELSKAYDEYKKIVTSLDVLKATTSRSFEAKEKELTEVRKKIQAVEKDKEQAEKAWKAGESSAAAAALKATADVSRADARVKQLQSELNTLKSAITTKDGELRALTASAEKHQNELEAAKQSDASQASRLALLEQQLDAGREAEKKAAATIERLSQEAKHAATQYDSLYEESRLLAVERDIAVGAVRRLEEENAALQEAIDKSGSISFDFGSRSGGKEEVPFATSAIKAAPKPRQSSAASQNSDAYAQNTTVSIKKPDMNTTARSTALPETPSSYRSILGVDRAASIAAVAEGTVLNALTPAYTTAKDHTSITARRELASKFSFGSGGVESDMGNADSEVSFVIKADHGVNTTAKKKHELLIKANVGSFEKNSSSGKGGMSARKWVLGAAFGVIGAVLVTSHHRSSSSSAAAKAKGTIRKENK